MRWAFIPIGLSLVFSVCQSVSAPMQKSTSGQGTVTSPTYSPLVSFPDRHSSLEKYLQANDREKRLPQYRDSAEALNIKLYELAYINASRAHYGAPPVQLDILASRVANRMAAEAAAGGFSGHWDLRGETPYLRYAFAGGVDHVAENAAAYSSSAQLPSDPRSLLKMMKQMHDAFMSEKAPYDGHKRNIIAPQHNYVGIGMAVKGGQFRYYEEFIDRYIDFIKAPTEVAAGSSFEVTVKPFDPKRYIYAVIAYYESFPHPMTAAQINRRGSYQDYTSTTALELWPWNIRRNARDNTVSLPMQFSKPGLYYIQMYLDDKPYSTSSASTQGKIQASGLVISVR